LDLLVMAFHLTGAVVVALIWWLVSGAPAGSPGRGTGDGGGNDGGSDRTPHPAMPPWSWHRGRGVGDRPQGSRRAASRRTRRPARW
jgi:hypothetical protein